MRYGISVGQEGAGKEEAGQRGSDVGGEKRAEVALRHALAAGEPEHHFELVAGVDLLLHRHAETAGIVVTTADSPRGSAHALPLRLHFASAAAPVPVYEVPVVALLRPVNNPISADLEQACGGGTQVEPWLAVETSSEGGTDRAVGHRAEVAGRAVDKIIVVVVAGAQPSRINILRRLAQVAGSVRGTFLAPRLALLAPPVQQVIPRVAYLALKPSGGGADPHEAAQAVGSVDPVGGGVENAALVAHRVLGGVEVAESLVAETGAVDEGEGGGAGEAWGGGSAGGAVGRTAETVGRSVGVVELIRSAQRSTAGQTAIERIPRQTPRAAPVNQTPRTPQRTTGAGPSSNIHVPRRAAKTSGRVAGLAPGEQRTADHAGPVVVDLVAEGVAGAEPRDQVEGGLAEGTVVEGVAADAGARTGQTGGVAEQVEPFLAGRALVLNCGRSHRCAVHAIPVHPCVIPASIGV